ncbi:hypothetical protein MKY88_10810 [Lysinibacillus sp. FSL R7-0073]|uniref:hypothetical protein n=1 Tax=Lysinibacillus sp. FSL R7-0073 TaxID=2921669 RepID=UPI0030F8030C
MVKYTPNYNLGKPEGTDMYSVLPQNANMDIIDTTLKGLDTKVTDLLADVVWQEAELLNGWESYGEGYEPKFAVDKHNNLIMKGAIKNGVMTRGTVLFILPEDMRPIVYRIFVTSCNNQIHDHYEYRAIELVIEPNGAVALGSSIPYTRFLGLENISIKL